ncbi:MAG: acyl-CoA thioesterase [Pseudomonadota bacterium]
MYPVGRLLATSLAARGRPRLNIDDVHVSRHMCLPWDLDMFFELNNGRTLTLFDLGRTGFALRTGFLDLVRRRRWALTVAGTSIRYRRRIRVFDRFEMRTMALGRDARFLYLHQTLWRGEVAACSALLRTAVTDQRGIVPTDRVTEAFGTPDWAPPLPGWVQAWIAAEDRRPWPPG